MSNLITKRLKALKCSVSTSIPTYKLPEKKNVKNTVKFLIDYQIKAFTIKDKTEVAKWTKDRLLELGPTFIKIGQFVSTRADIFDKELIEELKTLQDRTPPFPAYMAKEIITSELGKPYDEVFIDFIDRPIASASISQVHKAKLRSNNKDVVIKVQRPYIREYFDRDFTTLQTIFSFASVFNNRSINDSKLLLDDCYKYLYEELSFENEVGNLRLFHKILKVNTEIVIPRSYRRYCTSKVITMEYIPSKKIATMKGGQNREILSSVLMECFMKQILDYGIIHSDPHPGNVGLTTDGKIVLYDFGQVTKLDDSFAKNVKFLLFAVSERDSEAISDLLIKTKSIVLTRPMNKGELKGFVDEIIKYFETLDFKEFQLSMIDSDFGMDLPFKLNSKIFMMFRALSILEGICKELDPNFSYFRVIDVLMRDVFLDMDYIEHRVRKDLLSLFDNNSKIENIQNSIDASNKKYMKNMNNVLKEYQKIFVLLVLFNVWDFENVSKSIALICAFIYLIIKVK
jgi:predicted unusual protein kinase regulating ubiquinone biosynthesis (AarF/ABC1/UbiB family)